MWHFSYLRFAIKECSSCKIGLHWTNRENYKQIGIHKYIWTGTCGTVKMRGILRIHWSNVNEAEFTAHHNNHIEIGAFRNEVTAEFFQNSHHNESEQPNLSPHSGWILSVIVFIDRSARSGTRVEWHSYFAVILWNTGTLTQDRNYSGSIFTRATTAPHFGALYRRLQLRTRHGTTKWWGNSSLHFTPLSLREFTLFASWTVFQVIFPAIEEVPF